MRLLLAGLICVLFPATAAADVVVTSAPAERGVNYTVQGDGLANRIQTTQESGSIVVRETSGQTVVDQSDDCTQDGAAVRCPVFQGYGTTRVDVHGGAGPDALTDGAATANKFFAHHVILSGEEGDDDLYGTAFTELSGGDGADRLDGRIHGPDGGPGNDTLIGTRAGSNRNVYSWEPGADLYVTRPAGDSFFYDLAPGPVSVSLDAAANDGLAGEGDNVGNQADFLYGGPFADRLDITTAQVSGVDVAGGGGDDEIIGSAHADTMRGDAGADRISGGGGNDRLHLTPADDLAGGDGRDLLITAVAGYTGPAVDITLDGVANDGPLGETSANVHADVEELEGTPHADRLVGGPGFQALLGRAGDDELAGGPGTDALYGGPGTDVLHDRDGGHDHLDCGEDADGTVLGDDTDRVVACEATELQDRTPPPLRLRVPPSISARTRIFDVGVTTEGTANGVVEVRRGATVLARSRTALGPRTRITTLRLKPTHRRALLRTLRRRSVRVDVIATVTDAAGNTTTRKKRLTIRRR